MYDGVEKWQAMFKQYCEHREKEKDPNRFKNNRGCRLMEEIKKELILICHLIVDFHMELHIRQESDVIFPVFR